VTGGRVLAVDHAPGGGVAVVRCSRFDLRVTNPPKDWRPGDHVDVDAPALVRRHGGSPVPGPEVLRLPRSRVEHLYGRAAALAKLRALFASRDFVEVETPLLVRSPGLEVHLDAVPAGDGYLITSPEYQMKRLLAAGFERIYQVCKCFRAGERGAHHSSEFTMVEWYRAFAGLDAIRDDLEQLVAAVVGPVEWRRMTVRDAMRQWANVSVDGRETAEELSDAVRLAGIELAPGAAWDDAFFAAFVARVEPAIGRLAHGLFLEDWPAPLAALARRNDDATALRFEAYLGGLELANAFDELVDPAEQRTRFLEEQRVRRERGKPVYPIDEKLLAALDEGLPPSAGIALGFDRLVMLATRAASIVEVQSFSSDER
jgi:lysyl-tRNA synthetase class 2